MLSSLSSSIFSGWGSSASAQKTISAKDLAGGAIALVCKKGSFEVGRINACAMSPYLAEQQRVAGGPQVPLTIQLTADCFNSLDVMNFICGFLGSELDRATDVARQIASGVREDDTLAMLLLAAEELGCVTLVEALSAQVSNLLQNHQSPTALRDQFGIPNEFSAEEERKWSLAGIWGEAPREDPSVYMTRSMISLEHRAVNASTTFTEALTLDILQPRHSSSVVSDEAVTNCLGCREAFSVLVRRHHCRSCGRIFCAKCAPDAVELPPEARQNFQSPNLSARLFWWAANGFNSKLVRVCSTCKEEILDQHRFRIFIQGFERLALELPLLRRAVTISKKWRVAAMTSFRALLEIQYRLPIQELEPRERRLLWNNRRYWAGHSKWLLQLMKVVDWRSTEAAREAVALLRSPPICECKELLCSRMCTRTITAGDALELLSETMRNDEVRAWAVTQLRSAAPQELLCYLPLLVHDLSYEPMHASPLWQFLMAHALSVADPTVRKGSAPISASPVAPSAAPAEAPSTQASLFINDLYWCLMVQSECGSSDDRRRYTSFAQQLICEVTARYGPAYTRQLISGLDFVSLMEGLPTTEKNVSVVESYLRNKLPSLGLSKANPLSIPVDPRVRIASVDAANVKVKQSLTAPIVVPCVLSDGQQYRYMFKREDVRKDYLVLNIIRLMDMLLQKNGIDLHVLTYRVIPTSRTAGFVEMVQNAETVYDLSKAGNISNYITQYNGTRTIDEVLSVFQKSLAAYSVISYLLGLGDRHMENIMVTSTGVLFHIDYGYILGQDPKPMMPYMRITQPMIDAMGGPTSKHYAEFKVTCINAYMVLRRYTSLFVNLLLLIVKADPPIAGGITLAELQNQIRMRFLPGHLDKDAEATLVLRMEQSCDAISGSMADTLHSYNKETFSKGVNFLWNIAGRPAN